MTKVTFVDELFYDFFNFLAFLFDHPGIIRGSSGDHLGVIRGSSGGHLGVIRGSSGSHLGVIRGPFVDIFQHFSTKKMLDPKDNLSYTVLRADSGKNDGLGPNPLKS